MSENEIKVSQLYCYYIKSGQKTDLSETGAKLSENGIAFDRHWMVVDLEGNFVTQRENPLLATISSRIEDGLLILESPYQPHLRIPIDHAWQKRKVKIWNDTLEAIDDGNTAAVWISAVLNSKNRMDSDLSFRLVHIDPQAPRIKRETKMNFQDSWPLHVVSTNSLNELNMRIMGKGGGPVPIDRFRPNIVIEGVELFEEDAMGLLAIGSMELLIRLTKPDIRCAIISKDQMTGIAGREPMKTLLDFRRISEKDVIFGQKAQVLGEGIINVGDRIKVLDLKKLPRLLD